MFGYIKLDKYSPKIYKDYFVTNYCFLCRALDKHYGLFSRLFVSYDVTFFTILFSEDDYLKKIGKIHCVKSTKNLKEKVNENFAKKIAALNLALAAGELIDNIGDKDKFYAKPVYKAYRRVFNKVQKDFPLLCEIIENGHKNMDDIENNNGTIEEMENCFASMIDRITREIFEISNESKISIIKYVAKMLYFMDAIDDIDKDIKRKSFNALSLFNSKREYVLSHYNDLKEHLSKLRNEMIRNDDQSLNMATINRIIDVGIPETIVNICYRGIDL